MKPRALLTLLVFVTGCFPEVGNCDPVAAQRPVYDEGGLPAYEGQAVVLASCASNGVCHGEPSEDRLGSRFGAPAGLMFDVQLASFDGRVREDQIVRQRRARFRILQVSGNVLDAVHRGTMPPPSDGRVRPPPGMTLDEPLSAVEQFFEQAPVYLNASDERLPPAATARGQEILRNWLACGAPVIERTVARSDGVDSRVVARLNRTPIEATWTSIYTDLLTTRCNSDICHGGNADAGFLVLNDPTDMLDSLLTGEAAMATGLECADDGQALVVPNMPSESLLYRKVAGDPACGDAMPPRSSISEGDVMAIEQWIMEGANP